MTADEKLEVIKMVGSRLPKCRFHRLDDKDILAMIDRIIFECGDLTKKQVSNKIVEDCRQDYVNFRISEKIPGTKKRKTIRIERLEFGDYISTYLGMLCAADDDNASAGAQ